MSASPSLVVLSAGGAVGQTQPIDTVPSMVATTIPAATPSSVAEASPSEIVLSLAVDLSQPSKNGQARLTPPTVVTAAMFASELEAFDEDKPGYTLFDTPKEDMERAEDLLGMARGDLAVYRVKTSAAHLTCADCGRQNNFLDVVNTAVKGGTHSGNFLKRVFQGEFGYIANKNKYQRCECYQCGSLLPMEATKYLKPVPGVGPNLRTTPYYYHQPVYTYRF